MMNEYRIILKPGQHLERSAKNPGSYIGLVKDTNNHLVEHAQLKEIKKSEKAIEVLAIMTISVVIERAVTSTQWWRNNISPWISKQIHKAKIFSNEKFNTSFDVTVKAPKTVKEAEKQVASLDNMYTNMSEEEFNKYLIYYIGSLYALNSIKYSLQKATIDGDETGELKTKIIKETCESLNNVLNKHVKNLNDENITFINNLLNAETKKDGNSINVDEEKVEENFDCSQEELVKLKLLHR